MSVSNPIVNPDQTNTNPGGGLRVLANETLVGMRTRLGVLVNNGGVLRVKLPDTAAELALVIIDEEVASGELVNVSSILGEGNFRAVLNGTCVPGATLVLADPAASAGVNMGKVITLPATEGIYFSPGIAEESGVDEQHVLIRPLPRLVTVGTAFSSATPASTAPTNSSPYGFSQAQALALLTNVIEMRAFMVAQGWKATA